MQRLLVRKRLLLSAAIVGLRILYSTGAQAQTFAYGAYFDTSAPPSAYTLTGAPLMAVPLSPPFVPPGTTASPAPTAYVNTVVGTDFGHDYFSIVPQYSGAVATIHAPADIVLGIFPWRDVVIPATSAEGFGASAVLHLTLLDSSGETGYFNIYGVFQGTLRGGPMPTADSHFSPAPRIIPRSLKLGSYLYTLTSLNYTPFALSGTDGTFSVGVSAVRVVTVSGKVTLQGCIPSAVPDQSVFFDFREPGTTNILFTRTASLDRDGNYSFPDIPVGNYSVAIKGMKWLRKVVPVDASSGDVSSVDATLLAGDVTEHNAVTTADYLALKAAFGSQPGDRNWNPRADLNCDGAVTTTDYLLMKANFGLVGDL